MTTARLLAIGFIYVCAALAWGVLGGSLVARTGSSIRRLSREVALLWGGKHVQWRPRPGLERPRTRHRTDPGARRAGPRGHSRGDEGDGRARDHSPRQQPRRRGTAPRSAPERTASGTTPTPCGSEAAWRVHNPTRSTGASIVKFAFPSPDAIYDGFVFTVGSAQRAAVTDLSQGVDSAVVDVPPGAEVPMEIAYTSRGLGDWTYAFARQGVARVRRTSGSQMKTDFEAIDFPAGHDVAEREDAGRARAGPSRGGSTAW